MATFPRPKRRIRPALSLRAKLLLVSLAVLTIPWVGYEYVREMEAFLRQGQENALLATARAVAAVLHNRPELFQRHADLLRSAREDRELYIPALRSPIVLDGYTDDWREYMAQARSYAADNVLESKGEYHPASLSFKQLLGSYDRYLYTVLMVRDDHLVYRAPNSFRLDQSDHLQIALEGPDGHFYRYLLATQAPGWVNAHLMADNPLNPLPLKPEVRIKGEWQETPTGYTLELRIPLSMMGSKIAFAIADVDDPGTREVSTVIGTAGTRRIEELGTVIVPSPEIERILEGLERSAGRIWVVDGRKRVLALVGSLQSDPPRPAAAAEERSPTSFFMHMVYRSILKQPTEQFEDDLWGASRLEGQEIESALAGAGQTRWRPSPDRRTVILSATHPVLSEGQVIGAVVVEQTSNAILSLQNRAMENLFNVTLVVFLTATLALLTFASRLSSRIRRMRDEAERAIGPDGRVRGRVTVSAARDELGDLSRSVSSLLERIGQYTRYLETMASKLSHELRTPLAVVRSSLENLEMQSLPGEAGTYTRRAREGLERLGSILLSMSEASRLEQALQRAEPEYFDLRAVVAGCVEGYRFAYPHKSFALETAEGRLVMKGVPDLIAQMLDKLVSNAVDFSDGDTPIQVQLTSDRLAAHLTVIDQGAALPAQMAGRLFESMVSIRAQRGQEPHLGMGLYIVRLITEYHGGRAEAHDLRDVQGTAFSISLPLQSVDSDGQRVPNELPRREAN